MRELNFFIGSDHRNFADLTQIFIKACGASACYGLCNLKLSHEIDLMLCNVTLFNVENFIIELKDGLTKRVTK